MISKKVASAYYLQRAQERITELETALQSANSQLWQMTELANRRRIAELEALLKLQELTGVTQKASE